MQARHRQAANSGPAGGPLVTAPDQPQLGAEMHWVRPALGHAAQTMARYLPPTQTPTHRGPRLPMTRFRAMLGPRRYDLNFARSVAVLADISPQPCSGSRWTRRRSASASSPRVCSARANGDGAHRVVAALRPGLYFRDAVLGGPGQRRALQRRCHPSPRHRRWLRPDGQAVARPTPGDDTRLLRQNPQRAAINPDTISVATKPVGAPTSG